MSKNGDNNRVIRLSPYNYIHVLDSNRNITSVECGPKTFIRKDHEQIVLNPTAMINIPPRSYCIVGNPCVRTKDGKPEITANGMVRLTHGETEVRLHADWKSPFPLYPGEFVRKLPSSRHFLAHYARAGPCALRYPSVVQTNFVRVDHFWSLGSCRSL